MTRKRPQYRGIEDIIGPMNTRLKIRTSKYMPHQGAKEVARRIRQQKKLQDKCRVLPVKEGTHE